MTAYNTRNIINFRDIGGYKCDGGATVSGRFFRCGIPRSPTDSDVELLKSLGIKVIIDLRGTGEVKDQPSFFAGHPDFEYHNISLLEANPALTDVKLPVWEMYKMSLEDFKDGYRNVFRLLADIDSPVLFHCFLGKDRTGLLSSLMLLTAGVSMEDTVDDYAASYDLYKDFIEYEVSHNTGLIWKQDISRLRSDRIYIEKALDFINCNYGSVNGYLLSSGLSQSEIDRVKSKLIKTEGT